MVGICGGCIGFIVGFVSAFLIVAALQSSIDDRTAKNLLFTHGGKVYRLTEIQP